MRGWVAVSDRQTIGALAAVGTILVGVTIGFGLAAGAGWQRFIDTYALTNLVFGVAFLAAGLPIVWSVRNIVGPLLVASGLVHLTSAAATMIAVLGLDEAWPSPVIRTLSTLSTGPWQLGIALLFPLAVLLFPDGHLPSRRWAPAAWLIVVSGAFQMITGVLSDESGFGPSPQTDSILSIELELPDMVVDVAGAASGLGFLLAIAALVRRYVGGDDRTRRQLMWLILAMIAMLGLNAQRFVTGNGPILLLLTSVLVPIAIAIAIVRYELFDIRLVLSRTLLYGLTLAVTIAVYAGIVAGASLLMPATSERNASIGAVVVVAILFAPLRTFVQRTIDQAFYGTRSDPAGTAWQVGEGLRQHDDLPGMLDQTRTALRLPWMALRDGATGADIAASGTLDGTPVVDIPLTYRGGDVGALAVALRRGDRVLHDADRRTLELIATPLAVALHATSLSEQVRKARTATAEAAAAERARLQRGLHDGVGPALTSVAFQADAAFNLIRSDPAEAARLLADVRSDLRSASDDVRRVVYGLHPIALDEVGLLGAIRERLSDTAAELIRGVTVALDVPDELPELSPAVGLAAYRIANEALTNVFRHSDGRQCLIQITIDSDLEIKIRDDGTVPASWTPGVGMRSILDRAEEIGGSATVGPTDTGWEVVARLPLDRRGVSTQS